MNSLIHVHLGMMKQNIIYTTGDEAKSRAPYNSFMNSATCSPSFLRQRVTLDSANSDQSADTRLAHTYYEHGFNFYI
jgi:hypothetical protein